MTDTKTEIGRALDVRIAELLGWVHLHKAQDDWYGRTPEGSYDPIPHYSTDPAAAMGLLQKVRWNVDIQPQPADWWVKFWDEDREFVCRHPTLEGAIALAACAALEADREKEPGG